MPKTVYVCEGCELEYNKLDAAEECENSHEKILIYGIQIETGCTSFLHKIKAIRMPEKINLYNEVGKTVGVYQLTRIGQ